MVARSPGPAASNDRGDDAYYEQLQETWPAGRPSRSKRGYLRKHDRRVIVRADRREDPSPARMSKALLAAQREFARLQAEADARTAATTEEQSP